MPRSTPQASDSTTEQPNDAFDGALPRSFLRPALLLALVPGRSYGYDLMEQVRSFGLASADLGGVYRTLRSMELDEVVLSAWESSELGPPRRVYELTSAGLEAADRYLGALRTSRNHIDRIIDSVGRQ